MGRPRKPIGVGPVPVRMGSPNTNSVVNRARERRGRDGLVDAIDQSHIDSDPGSLFCFSFSQPLEHRSLSDRDFSEFSPSNSFRLMSNAALNRPKRHRFDATLADSSYNLAAGLEKLKVTTDIRTTFAQFATNEIGNLAQSFYGLVSTSDSASPAPSSPASSSLSHLKSDSPQNVTAPSSSARFYYESAIRGIKSQLVPNEDATTRSKRIGETHMLWERWASELVKWSTMGVPEGRGMRLGADGEEPLVRTLFTPRSALTLYRN